MATVMGGNGAAVYVKPVKEEAPEKEIETTSVETIEEVPVVEEPEIESVEEVSVSEEPEIESVEEVPVVEEPEMESVEEVSVSEESREQVEETIESPKRPSKRKSTKSRRKS